jgi:thiazole biosynthesis enzyme
MPKIFADVSEKEITRSIATMFMETMNEYTDSDVIIIGAGPAGLSAGRELGKLGLKTLIIEQNNYIGGGYWVGGYMMNPVTVRSPAHKIWDELGVPYRIIREGLYATWGPHACSKLIAATCDAGVRFLQLTKFDDLVIKNKRVSGVVVNWMPVSAFESKIVIDASGHDSVAVKRLMERGFVKWKGMDPMCVEGGEDAVVNHTGEVFPGLIATGMSVTETHGLPRMGPTFGSMLLSGKKAAEIAARKLKEVPQIPN